MKVYIAGKITGDPNYRRKFNAARMMLEKQGDVVISPADLPSELTPAEAMHICIPMMEVADIVALLPDYFESDGAMLELAWCRYTGEETALIDSIKLRRYENCPLNKQYGKAGLDGEKCRGFAKSKYDDEPCEVCKKCKVNFAYEEE